VTIFQAIVYGLIQGLTEFLPVSSSAHLTLLPTFTGWPDPGLSFDVALHWGTLIAALIYFRRDLIKMTVDALAYLSGARTPESEFPWKIVVATVPGAIIGFLFEKQADTLFRSPWLIAGTLSIMGLWFLVADRFGKKQISLDQISWRNAILIGLSQGLAIIPGVSRSGITITSALLLGLDRSAAVRFSFFLSIPIIFGAGLVKAKYLIGNAGDPALIAGMLVSALSGLMAIHLLITYVRTRSFMPFVVYRLALAGSVVACLLLR
jgi:undecaprenyl-diphosphatase